MIPDRPRSWFALFLHSGGILAMALSVFMVLATVMASFAYREAANFENSGEWTVATIAERRVDRTGDETEFLVRFEYSVQGADFSRERDVGRRYFGAHSEGETVSIKVLPDSPGRFEFVEGSTHTAAKVAQFFALLTGVGALAALWFPGYRAARLILARRFGRAGLARITKIVERREKAGRITKRAHFHFQDDEGREGKSLDFDRRDLGLLGVGGQVSVFAKGGKLYWEGDTGPRPDVPRRLPRVVDKGN